MAAVTAKRARLSHQDQRLREAMALRLRLLRHRACLGQAELARSCGWSRKAQSCYERETNSREPGMSKAPRLAAGLGVTVRDLLEAPISAERSEMEAISRSPSAEVMAAALITVEGKK